MLTYFNITQIVLGGNYFYLTLQLESIKYDEIQYILPGGLLDNGNSGVYREKSYNIIYYNII